MNQVRRLLLTLLLLLPFQGSADSVSEMIARTAQLQSIYKGAENILAVRWFTASDGSTLLVARSQKSPYGAPTMIPLMNVGGPASTPARFVEAAGRDLIAEYEAGRHRLKPELAARVKASLERSLASFDPRGIWYEMHAPELGEPAGAIRLYDASTEKPEHREIAPMEQWYEWTFPERGQPGVGLVELQFAYRNPRAEIRILEAPRYVLQEAATYIDLFYVSKNHRTVVRLVTTRNSRSQRFLQYGFVEDNDVPNRFPELLALKMEGAEFVERFGSRWPTWQKMYELSQSPPNPLFHPEAFHARVEAYLQRMGREFKCSTSIREIEEFPTLSHYMDGLFNPIFDASDTPLLF